MQPALRVSPTPGNRAETEPHYRARPLLMLADLGGPAEAACMGDPARFRHRKQFRSFTGLVYRPREQCVTFALP
jgi:hypothetical protein